MRIGEDRLIGTGKFYYGREIMRALNEAVRVQRIRDDGVLLIERAIGSAPAQPIRRGDTLCIIGVAV